MHTKTYFVSFTVLLVAFLFPLLSTGCELTDNDDATEYVNEEVSYADGESCVERYLLYEEDGTYERYIAGMYFGNKMPGIYFGTLFETGAYTVDDIKAAKNIKFSPKKQYDFESKRLEYLGLEGQVPFYGTLTEKKLIIYWYVSNSFEPIELEYKRK